MAKSQTPKRNTPKIYKIGLSEECYVSISLSAVQCKKSLMRS